MRTVTYVSVVLLILSSVIGSAAGQAPHPISLGFASALPLPIGQMPVITVTVTDIANSTVQLTFLGLRFEWGSPTTWFIGGGSNAGAVLSAGQQIIYHIPVAIPNNVTAGTHRLTTYVTYRWFKDGTWTGLLAGFWASDFPLAYAQTRSQQTATQNQAQIQTTSKQVGTPQTYNLLTYGIVAIAALVTIVGVALYIGRVKRIEEKRKTSPKPTRPKKLRNP